MKAIKASDLTKMFLQGEETIYAVKDVFLSIEQGEFVSITGTSGCGKSTLLHMLAGLLSPTKGKVEIDGEDIGRFNERESAKLRCEKIGFIFQQFNLIPVMTARENIVISSLFKEAKLDERWFAELVERLSIADRLSHFPSELSGGQMQRVAIARALINRPKILFADEPTGNLDSANADAILDILSELHAENNLTVVLVTHDPEIAEKAGRILVMDNGEIK